MCTRQDLKAVALVLGALFVLGGGAPAEAAYQCQEDNERIEDAVCFTSGDASLILSKAEAGQRTLTVPGSTTVDLPDDRIFLPLGNTGIARWTFLNPRKPFPLTPADEVPEQCRKAALRCVLVEFDNQTLDREFDATFNFTLNVPQIGNLGLAARIAALELKASQGERALLPNAEPNQEMARSIDYLERLVTAATAAEFKRNTLALSAEDAGTALNRCESALEALLTTIPAPVKKEEEAARRSELDRLKQELTTCSDFLASLVPSATEQGLMGGATRVEAIAQEARAFGGDIQRLSDLLALSNPQNTCKLKKGTRTLECSYRHSIPAGVIRPLPPIVISLLPPDETIDFTVSLQQEADDGVLTNKTGYLATGPEGSEPDNQVTWTAATSIGYNYKPGKPEKKQADGKATTVLYDGQRTADYSAVGRLGFSANLGDRARGDVTLGYKSGSLDDRSSDKAKAEQYTFSIFAKSGLTLRMGRYDIDAPGSGIAINESGEGFELTRNSFSLAYLTHRESTNKEKKPDIEDLDSDVYILQIRDLPFFGGRFLRSANFIALYGADEKDKYTDDLPSVPDPDNPPPPTDLNSSHQFWTAGAEVFFAVPRKFSGSIAHFRSKLDRDRIFVEPQNDGVGDVTLLTFGRSWVKDDENGEKKLESKLTFVAGEGSGDDPKTTKRDEGYLGETASDFTGNTFLLGRLAGKIPGVTEGLVNKTYAGLVFTDNARVARRISPLRAFVKALRTDDPIVDESFVLRLYGFRFNEPVNGEHEASLEATTEFSIQIPKGVWTTLKLGGLRPGPALRPAFEKDHRYTWFIAGEVKLDIK